MTRLLQSGTQAYIKNFSYDRPEHETVDLDATPLGVSFVSDRETACAGLADHPKLPPTKPFSSLWLRAFIESLVALILCLVVVSFWVLRREINEFRATQLLFPTYCTSLHDGKSMIAIVAPRLSFESQRKTHLVQNDFSTELPPTRLDFPIDNPVCIDVASNGENLFVGTADGTVYCVDLKGTKSLTVLRDSTIGGYPLGLASSQDGKTLVTLDLTGLYAWNVEIGNYEQEPGQGHQRWHQRSEPVSCFAIFPDSKTGVCCRTNQGQIELAEFSIETGEIKLIIERMPSLIEKLTISPDGEFLVCLMQSGEINLFNRPLSSELWKRCVIPGLGTGSSFIASFSPNAAILITSDMDGSRLVAWNLAEKKVEHEFDVHYRNSVMMGCEFLDDNRMLSWGQDNILRVWDLHAASPVREVKLQQ
ncbi:MAG: WD40 repeat domain-containing protein [Pirellula sp.]|nr:WD40 repeat domain-containing protein [Pirellula sp.]